MARRVFVVGGAHTRNHPRNSMEPFAYLSTHDVHSLSSQDHLAIIQLSITYFMSLKVFCFAVSLTSN